MHRFHPANLRAAWWAIRTARRTRRLLNRDGLDAALAPPPPPPLPVEAERGVRGSLRRCHETCLVNSIVLQAWHAAHGRNRDLVIGITGPDNFRAHAWIQGDPVPEVEEDAIDMSVLGSSGFRSSMMMPAESNWTTAADDDRRAVTEFTELLRRPAPKYGANGSVRIR